MEKKGKWPNWQGLGYGDIEAQSTNYTNSADIVPVYLPPPSR